MKRAHWHTFQILTKRAERLEELNPKIEWPENVWMGASVGDQDYTFRIDHLSRTGVKVEFFSLEPLHNLNLEGINCVIVSGESRPGARPMKRVWVTDIRDQCLRARAPFFFKQWGGTNKKKAGRMLEGRAWNEMPRRIQAAVA